MTEAIQAGIRFFQYRNKISARRNIYHVSRGLAEQARKAGVIFLINDHADIAAAVGADGVHLGQEDLPVKEARRVLGSEKIVGLSTHGREQAVWAEKAGADYIGFGPIYPTNTKDAGQIQGLAGLSAIKEAVSLPVIAIGGICHDNARSVLSAGADGIAVISAILGAADFRQAAADMVKRTGIRLETATKEY